MKYLDTKQGSVEEAISQAMGGVVAKDLLEAGGKYLKYSDLLLQKGRLLAKGSNTAMIDKEISKEMKKLGIKESKDEYEKFFNSALKKFGVDSPADFKDDAKKKEFFNYVDKNYKAKAEETNLEEGRMKELHGYIAKGMSAQQIAKKMNLDVKAIEALMKEQARNDIKEYIQSDGTRRKVKEGDKRRTENKLNEKDLNKNVDETLDAVRESNVAKQKSMREILADIWNMGEGKNVFDLEEAASLFISTPDRSEVGMKDSKEFTAAIKKHKLKSKFVQTASKNGHEVTGRNINDITKFITDFFGKDDLEDRFVKKGNKYVDMYDEGFSSDAQRKAAFASGYKEKDKKKEEVKKEGKTATGEKPTKVELDPKVK